MLKWFFFILLLCWSQDEANGCNSQSSQACRSVWFSCPRGKTYRIPRYKRDGQCLISKDTKHILDHCWSNTYAARKCMEKADTCSSPFGGLSVRLTNYWFHTACNTHDMCYYSKGLSRSYCDRQFRDNMLDSCSGVDSVEWGGWGVGYIGCDAAAYLLFAGVTVVGEFGHWYTEGQKDGCWRKGQRVDECDQAENLSVGRANTTFGIEHIDLVQSYNEIQGKCLAHFGNGTSNLWNDTQPLIENCKSQKSKENSVQCWKKIRKETKVELKKKKDSLIECVDIQQKTTNKINMDPKTTNRRDTVDLEKSELWIKAKNNKMDLIPLAKEAVTVIENRWKQSQIYWNNCWKKSMKLARNEGIEEANKKIDSCWRMKIDKKIKTDLDNNE